jgi:CheY-like chemotaxis protein
MDCLMPRMDGIEATRRLRAGEAGPRQPPVVALTAHAMSGDRQACIEAGMNGFLTKPLTAHDLAQALARWSPARPAP